MKDLFGYFMVLTTILTLVGGIVAAVWVYKKYTSLPGRLAVVDKRNTAFFDELKAILLAFLAGIATSAVIAFFGLACASVARNISPVTLLIISMIAIIPAVFYYKLIFPDIRAYSVFLVRWRYGGLSL